MPARCEQCGSEEYMPYACKFCQGRYCAAHRLPENHGCAGLGAHQQKMRDEGRIYREPSVVSPSVSASARASISMEAFWSRVQGKMTYIFLGIIAAVYVLEFLVLGAAGPDAFYSVFTIGPDFYLRPWTILTSIFAHSLGDFSHILFNGLILYFFGTSIERLIGTRRFTWLFLGSGAVAGIVQVLIFGGRALGASGALMALVGLLVFLAPRLSVLIFGILPAPMWAVGIFYVGADVLGLVGGSAGIAHLAHLSGFAIGAAYAQRLKQKGLRVQQPPPRVRQF